MATLSLQPHILQYEQRPEQQPIYLDFIQFDQSSFRLIVKLLSTTINLNTNHPVYTLFGRVVLAP